MFEKPLISRCLPFGVYMAFILIQDLAGKVLPDGLWLTHVTAVLYPVKIAAVCAALAACWKTCDELTWKSASLSGMLWASGVGVLVFVLWIHMDWDFAVMGEMKGYDPRTLPAPWMVWAFISVRLLGASLVVPVFEELFWRSFILRYIVNPDFTKVPVGAFTWPSFAVSCILFGAEHHMWLAGVMAGAAYALLLYKTRSVPACMVSHGITNLLLGIHVVYTRNWQFW